MLVGSLLLFMTLSITSLRRLPLSNAMLYLVVGIVMGRPFLGWINLNAIQDAGIIELVTEFAILISLFTTGMRLRVGLFDPRWRVPLLLASGAMVLTVVLVSLLGVYLLGLPLGAAVILGAALAPTDPVLASDVHAGPVGQRDAVRFGLAGEAGLNDGTAFPFVVLGLYLLGGDSLRTIWTRWLVLDLVWAIAAGLLVGAVLGTACGRLVLYLRRAHLATGDMDDFFGLGLIAISYGVALLVHGYGFLAVFAAGTALRYTEMRLAPGRSEPLPLHAAVVASPSAEQQAAQMTHSVLMFNEHVERIAEVAVVMLIGALAAQLSIGLDVAAFLAILLFVVRPLSVAPFLKAAGTTWVQSGIIAWFGIRGIGSIYYLVYAVQHGLSQPLAERVAAVVVSAVAASILVHGITATPFMRWYGRG